LFPLILHCALHQSGVDLLRIAGRQIVEARLFSGDQAQEDAF
jgi:hypothetical protein